MRRLLLSLFLVVTMAMTMSAGDVIPLTGIRSTGSQAFNTGYIHKANTRVEMDCKVLKDHQSWWEALLGGRFENYTKNAFCFFSRTNGGDIPCFNRSGDESRGAGFVYGERIKLVCEGQTATWYRYSSPNEVAGSVTTEGTADEGKTPMLLFNLNTSANENDIQIDTSPSCMTLYGCKIFEGDNLVCDFVPAMSDGVVGLFDTVNNIFGGSITDSGFLKSEEDQANNIDGFTELLTNGVCNGTYDGWEKVDGGDGWTIETDVDGSYFWTSSYAECTLSQTVTLSDKGYSDDLIDSGNIILKASALMRSVWEKDGKGSKIARVQVEEQDVNGNVLCVVSVLDDNSVIPEWKLFETSLFPLLPKTRKLKYIVSGKDAVYWSGHFGPSFKLLSLQAGVSGPAPTAYSISLNVGVGGSATASATQASTATRVEIYASPDYGKKVESVTVTDANGWGVGVTSVSETQQKSTYFFIMPACNVTVDVAFTDDDALIPYEAGTVIDFETGDFSQFSFNHDDMYPWIVISDGASGGTYCIKSSNSGIPSSRSSLSATYTFSEDGYVAFDAKCNGEGSNTFWDECSFYIDDEKKFSRGAGGDSWDNYYFYVSAGTHTFEWLYTKDSSVDYGGDAFFLDNIVFGNGVYCTVPSNIRVTSTLSSTEITWKGSSESFNLRYRLAGTETWTYVNGITENSYTMENLAPGSYEVGVQSTCEGTTIVSTTFEIVDVSNSLMCYGYANYTFDTTLDWRDKFISFPVQAPSLVSAVSGVFPENYAAAYIDGYVWFITTEASDLCRAPLDLQTGTIGDYEIVTPNFMAGAGIAISMDYNYNDGMMYVLFSADSATKLYRFCLDKPSSPTVFNLNVSAQTFAIDSNGFAYIIEYNWPGRLYRVDLTNGSTTFVGDTGVGAFYVQSMAFDLDTNNLYWAQICDANSYGFYHVDTSTADLQFLGQVGTGAEITGLFIIPSNPLKNHANFETNDFSQLNFQNDDTYPWIVTNIDASTGVYSMKSGNAGVASSSSVISATYNFTEDGYVCFDAKCMGEGTSSPLDKCIFYIDNVAQFTNGALGDVWNAYAYPVAAGSHTFKWEYKKNGSVNPSGDAFYVDNIYFPQGVTAQSVATGVENIDANRDQDESIYNLAGQRLNKKQTGINIVNKQKVMVK